MTMDRTIVSYPAAFAVCFVCIGLVYPISAQTIEIKKWSSGEIGEVATISCEVEPETANVTWHFNGNILIANDVIVKNKDDLINRKNSTITIANATASNAGNYTCEASTDADTKEDVVTLDLYFQPKFINASSLLKGNVSEIATVDAWCIFEVYNSSNVNVKWYKKDGGVKNVSCEAEVSSPKNCISKNKIPTHRAEDEGTYICEIVDGNITAQGNIEVLVTDFPKVVIDTAIGISTTEIFFNWTVHKYHSDIKAYHLSVMTLPNDVYEHYGNSDVPKIYPQNTSFVLGGRNKSTTYSLKFEVKTDYGSSKWTESLARKVSTLDFDPVFVPNISINGFSATSVTIGWKKPSEDVAPYIHYYILEAKKKGEEASKRAFHSRDGNNLPYMFDYLQPHSTYVFKVCACSDYTGKCGEWSGEMEAATSDGIPTEPVHVKAVCSATFMSLTWGSPDHPNAEIKGYTMELTGKASFRDRTGKAQQVTWGPLSKFTTNKTRNVRFDDLHPNTNYTVRLSAMTRTRRRGKEVTDSCSTLHAPPDHEPRPRWRKILQDDKYMFKMYLPRISERNGPLCCYRVYMVRLLPQSDWMNMPSPKDITVMEHKDAHSQPPVLGAYITDIFSNDNFPHDYELVMGDGKSQFNRSEPTFNNHVCNLCLKKPRRFVPTTTTTTTTPSTTTEFEDETDDPLPDRRRRSIEEEIDYTNVSTMKNGPTLPGQLISDRDAVVVFDGPLDTSVNYTLFVELITQIDGEPPMFSEYVNVLMPAPTPPVAQPTSVVEIALQATCAVAALVLLLMILFCIRQTRRSRKMPPHAPLEMNSLQAAFRASDSDDESEQAHMEVLRAISPMNMFRGRGPHTPTAPPDMDPIPKDELAAAYAERQVDSDYGFQKEFELLQMLPECFTDRTTHASEARENQPKNRYPDIKAYDQTRVKLTQLDGITGSDYINANYVMGYQDRKQFICAQGPTDTTVNDFWRMVWEHGLELIVMLTNLEEYSKVKCSKYWPDEVRGSRAFGNLTVHHVTEKRYSDYIVRELKITKQPLNSDGQPIVEGNGIAKRNGDCKEPFDGSAPTSPREVKEPETRIVKQYHFLMWKDFAAPEHAYSILKFIKRVNEAWSGMLGRACVVHCSAGVGRTGTLVALDCLLEQLRDVGHAAVFNTVAELRRSRNFLVQSLKQYVFVYRALVEYAHYGDTEIPASRLKSYLDRLRNMPPQATSCLMEIEFEKILNSPIPEPIKSCAAGAAEELRTKNRSVDILPYDRNRVILAPIPGRDYSTYINASFIEAYDNSEGFIITQDPMQSTIMDFWRMVSEHNVTTIVMLSELGDGKCPRYWDDGTAQYEHISVQYEESESCPYYTRRQFRVVNNKSGCSTCVRQLQYQGWPTAPGHVPEVTRGLAELADAAAPRDAGAMLVHCHLGTERSALFVALCILICQLRTERRVDVCCVARKVRSQRVKTINTFLQYEFLHRAILNYAELHNLLELEDS